MNISVLKSSVYAFSGAIAWGALSTSAATVNLTPTADTYVASASTAQGVAQGAQISLVANQGTNTNHRWTYIRFDLSAASGVTWSQVTNLELDLTKVSTANSTTTIDVYGLVNAENFDESALTYNNDPNRSTTGSANTFAPVSATSTNNAYNGTKLLSFSAASGASGAKDVAFSVGTGSALFNFINADSDKIVTFVLDQETWTNADGQAWGSKENTTAANRPVLIATVPEPASLGLLAMGSIGALSRRRRKA